MRAPSIPRAVARVAMVLCLPLSVSLPACGSSDESDDWREAFDATELGWFLNVWGPAEDDLYAVGGQPTRGLVMHFDGKRWDPVDLGVEVPLITWMYGFGPTDITAVGFAGTAMHWDGSAWIVEATPTSEDLWGVWGSAPDDLWAVGGSGRPGAVATLLRRDAAGWSEVTLPPITRPNVFALFKVFGTSKDNVYAVGQRGVVLHWEGVSWQEEDTGATDDLVSLWGTGPDRLVAVGGRADGIVSVWNGSAWRTESLAPLSGFNGVWMNEPGVAHVVGTLGTLVDIDLTSLDGPGALVYEDSSLLSALDFHGVFSATGKTLFAVGGNLTVPSDTFQGIAYQRSATPR